jgi:rhodanese-related sulfurtransferase
MVLRTPAADSRTAHEHFASKLTHETDPSDVYADLSSGVDGIIVIDARSAESYARGHVPGAISLPYRKIDAVSTASISNSKVIVTYCEGVFCNASTKAAEKLTALGFRVKEMLDGMDGWKKEGLPVE